MSTNRTYGCPCGSKIVFTNGSSLGDFNKKTGWTPVLTYTGSVIRLCPVCFEKANRVAKELQSIMGTKDFYFQGLFKRDE